MRSARTCSTFRPRCSGTARSSSEFAAGLSRFRLERSRKPTGSWVPSCDCDLKQMARCSSAGCPGLVRYASMSEPLEDRRVLLALVLLAVQMFGSSVTLAEPASFFADHRAREVGDVLTIVIAESASVSQTARTRADKSNEVGGT